MSDIYPILTYPDPRLRKIAKPVEVFDTERLDNIFNKMIATMYASEGIGLAGTQVDIHERLIVIDISDEQGKPLKLVNPSFEPISEEKIDFKEGCLSVPEFYDNINAIRYQHIAVKAQNSSGEFFSFEAEDLLSICVQHEIDHLNGKLFVDYLPQYKRDKIAKQLKKSSKNP